MFFIFMDHFLLPLCELPALIFWLFFYQELLIFLQGLIVPFYIMFINSLCVKFVENFFQFVIYL